MIGTNIEQSKHLLKLGIDPKTADMHYVRKITDFMGNPVDGKFSVPKYGNTESKHANYMVQNFTDYELLPAWSLSALLDFLPEKIEPFYYISLEKYEKGYRIAYLYTIGGELQHLIQYIGETAIDVAYDMVCIILENKLKRNE